MCARNTSINKITSWNMMQFLVTVPKKHLWLTQQIVLNFISSGARLTRLELYLFFIFKKNK